MAGDGKNTDDVTISMLFLFNKEGNIILDAMQEYQEVEVLLSDKAKDRGKFKPTVSLSIPKVICHVIFFNIDINLVSSLHTS